MIALDCHPFSLVEDEGFTRLRELEPRYSLPSRRYFTENIVTNLFNNLKTEVTQAVSSVSFFSFTTDIWTTNVSNKSLLSFTAHWITDEKHSQHIDGSHTGSCIAEKITGLGIFLMIKYMLSFVIMNPILLEL